MSNIDADALERAAKSVREIERSRVAKQVFEMSKRESDVKIAEEARKSEEARAQAAAYAIEQEKVGGARAGRRGSGAAASKRLVAATGVLLR